MLRPRLSMPPPPVWKADSKPKSLCTVLFVMVKHILVIRCGWLGVRRGMRGAPSPRCLMEMMKCEKGEDVGRCSRFLSLGRHDGTPLVLPGSLPVCLTTWYTSSLHLCLQVHAHGIGLPMLGGSYDVSWNLISLPRTHLLFDLSSSLNSFCLGVDDPLDAKKQKTKLAPTRRCGSGVWQPASLGAASLWRRQLRPRRRRPWRVRHVAGL